MANVRRRRQQQQTLPFTTTLRKHTTCVSLSLHLLLLASTEAHELPHPILHSQKRRGEEKRRDK
jgi:hypothetical protein